MAMGNDPSDSTGVIVIVPLLVGLELDVSTSVGGPCPKAAPTGIKATSSGKIMFEISRYHASAGIASSPQPVRPTQRCHRPSTVSGHFQSSRTQQPCRRGMVEYSLAWDGLWDTKCACDLQIFVFISTRMVQQILQRNVDYIEVGQY